MFARKCSAVLEHQLGDFLGDGLELAHAFLGLEVDHRPHMKAADRGVRIDAGRRPVARDDLQELVDIVAQVLGRDRGVLDERDRLGVSFLGHRKPQRHRAELPHACLRRRVRDGQMAIAQPVLTQFVLQGGEPGRQEVGAFVVQLDQQDRRGIALEEVAQPARLGIQAGANRARTCPPLQPPPGRAPGSRAWPPGPRASQRTRRRAWPGRGPLDQLQLGLDGQAERSLRPDQQAGQVEAESALAARARRNELIQVVSANAAQDLGEAAVDLLGMLGGQPPGHAVTGAFQVCPAHLGLELRLRHRLQVDQAAVGQNGLQLEHMIDRLAVEHDLAPEEFFFFFFLLLSSACSSFAGAILIGSGAHNIKTAVRKRF